MSSPKRSDRNSRRRKAETVEVVERASNPKRSDRSSRRRKAETVEVAKRASNPAPLVVRLDVTRGGPGAPRWGRELTALARAFAADLRLGPAELSLTLVRDAQIRELKHEWFGVDAATDVLSFPAGDGPVPPGEPRPLGDVVISLETARRAALELETSLAHELALYLAHGLLHLLGFDHQSKADARRMAARERALLGHAGMLHRSAEL